MAWFKLKRKPKDLKKVAVYADSMTGDIVIRKGSMYKKLKEMV
jgi:hypothetical protein